MFRTHRIAPLILAGLLHFTPLASRTLSGLALPTSPVGVVMRWVAGGLALVGTFHAVSAASAVLLSATKINGTAGTRLSYQIKVNDGQSRLPESWVVGGKVYGRTGSTTNSLPPGLSMALTTGIISGIPTEGGVFAVPISAYEKPNLGGAHLSFTLTFTITGSTAHPTVTTPPANITLHVGEALTLTVVATGTDPLKYQWRHNGVEASGANAATFTIPSTSDTDSGTYDVIVSDVTGSVTSSAATVTLVPLSVQVVNVNTYGVTVQAKTIPGRHYIVEASDALTAVWSSVSDLIAPDTSMTYVDTQLANPQRYWRVRVAP